MIEVPPPPPVSGQDPPAADASDVGVGAPYRVQLPSFEGPLDLLLHLIEEHELDIRDIPIAFVAHKYVEYITLMEELNIDVASEYLVMAATLAHIKSKMLLPTPPEDDKEEDESDLDPRAELVRRLLEYQKYKHAAEHLGGQALLGRDVFGRGMSDPQIEGPAPIAGLGLFKLLEAFQAVLSRAKVTVDHPIDFERFSITDRILELSDLLRRNPRIAFEALFEGQRARGDLIITFLALLEMTRLRLTRLYQDGPLEVIVIELAVTEEYLNGEGAGLLAEKAADAPNGNAASEIETGASGNAEGDPDNGRAGDGAWDGDLSKHSDTERTDGN